MNVRREVALGSTFTREEFEKAFESFKQLYNTVPTRVVCAPDVLARCCELFERAGEAVHAHSLRMTYWGVPIVAAIVAPGTVAFEGDVDDVKMGDW